MRAIHVNQDTGEISIVDSGSAFARELIRSGEAIEFRMGDHWDGFVEPMMYELIEYYTCLPQWRQQSLLSFSAEGKKRVIENMKREHPYYDREIKESRRRLMNELVPSVRWKLVKRLASPVGPSIFVESYRRWFKELLSTVSDDEKDD